MKDWATLPLRFGVGIIFIYHGLQKAFGLFGGPGLAGFTSMISGLGIAPAEFVAGLVAYIELLAGLAILIGIFTRVSAGLIIAIMLVAIFKVHLPNGFSAMNGGIEYQFMLICACLTLIFMGPGKLCMCKKS